MTIKELNYVGEPIGRYQYFAHETYAECIRVKVERETEDEDNCWLLTLKDGVLFVYAVCKGKSRLRLCASVFNIYCRES